MSKKSLSLLLVVCMFFCLSACGATETSSNQINKTSESQAGASQKNEERTQTESESNEASLNTETSKEDGTTQTQSPTDQSNSNTNQSIHTHRYSNATCTSPQKCSCGVTMGAPLGHNYSEATCTTPKICKNCNTKAGEALGHSWKEATCDSAKFCRRCNLTEGISLGHNYDSKHDCTRCGIKDPLFCPQALSKLKSYKTDESKHGWFSFSDSRTDIFGEKHSDIIYVSGGFSSSTGSALETYRINQKYERITGTIFLSESEKTTHILVKL